MSIKQAINGCMMMFISMMSVLIVAGWAGAQEGPLEEKGVNILPPDRRINWNPGIPGGIPVRKTVYCDITDPPYNAAGDGVADDTAALQLALDDCPEGQVVWVPPGEYRLTYGLTIRKGIVLRGAGPKKTMLRFYRDVDKTYPPNIFIRNDRFSDLMPLEGEYAKGTTSLTLQSAADLEEGDLIYINQDNDGELVSNQGFDDPCTWCGDFPGTRCMGQTLLVLGVQGNTVTIEPSLYWTYREELNPAIRKVEGAVSFAGLEDLYVDNFNEAVEASIKLSGCKYCWVRNIESYRGQHHFQINYTYGSVVRDSYIHHHHIYEPNHYCVLMGKYASANLVENNLFYHTKGGTMMASWGASGNVFGYNYCDTTLYTGKFGLQSNITHHGAHPMMNLWEGNIVTKISSDQYWGTSSHNTVFRNHARRENNPDATNYTRFCLVLEAQAFYFNVVGNVFGYENMPGGYEIEGVPCSFSTTAAVYKLGYTNGSDEDPEGNDPLVKETLLRHGNYDYHHNATIWDPAIAKRTLPDSYYLQAKPKFFGGLTWPPIGPDVPGLVNPIPAQLRFEGTPLPPAHNLLLMVVPSISNGGAGTAN